MMIFLAIITCITNKLFFFLLKVTTLKRVFINNYISRTLWHYPTHKIVGRDPNPSVLTKWMDDIVSATEKQLKLTIPRWRSDWTWTFNINAMAEKVFRINYEWQKAKHGAKRLLAVFVIHSWVSLYRMSVALSISQQLLLTICVCGFVWVKTILWSTMRKSGISVRSCDMLLAIELAKA